MIDNSNENQKHEMIQKLLKEAFDNVNNWLIFAEAKNAAMIAFNVACLAAIFNGNILGGNKNLFYFISIGLLIATMISLVSFLPKMDKDNTDIASHSADDNLIYYKDIAKYNNKDYLKQIFKKYAEIDIPENKIQNIEVDFASEITYNAAVVVRKYKFFQCALIVEFLILILLICMLIVA